MEPAIHAYVTACLTPVCKASISMLLSSRIDSSGVTCEACKKDLGDIPEPIDYHRSST